MGLLANFFSFTSFSYKIGLLHTLVDRAYKIHNSLAKFNDDVNKLYYIFKKNQYPEGLINRVVKSYCDKVHISNNFTPLITAKDCVPRSLRPSIVYKFVQNVILCMLVKQADIYPLPYLQTFKKFQCLQRGM